MVVISLIIILASIGLVQYRQSIIHTNEAVLKDDLVKLREALDQYYADKNKYPESLEALVADGYIRDVPQDPFTKSATTWQTELSDIDPANPTAAPGVKDVHSGAEGNALDGSPYSGW
jgi:general secretion pathway protein G